MAYVTDREGSQVPQTETGRLRVPTYNQLAIDEVGPVEPYAARSTDCGEECVSMVLYAVTKAYYPEGQLRRQLGLPTLDGRTTAGQLVELMREFDLSATIKSTTGRVRDLVKPAVSQGKPVLCLGYYVSPGFLHWVVAVDYGGGRVGFNDPWSGTLRYETWPWFQRASTGQCIIVEHPVGRAS